MDTFTRKHLIDWVETVVWEQDRSGFVAYIESLNVEDFDYWCNVGWAAAFHFYQTRVAA